MLPSKMYTAARLVLVSVVRIFDTMSAEVRECDPHFAAMIERIGDAASEALDEAKSKEASCLAGGRA